MSGGHKRGTMKNTDQPGMFEDVARTIGSTLGAAVRKAGEVADDIALVATKASPKKSKKVPKEPANRARKPVQAAVKRKISARKVGAVKSTKRAAPRRKTKG
jgi:hypothetical protein